jgi:hypothetical protein
MTERYGYGYGDEPRDQRPSGRGAVTERQEREDRGDQEVREIDLTDTAQEQAAAEEEAEDEQARAQREAADAFEPAAASEADEEQQQQEEQEEDVRPGGGPSIFDVGQRDSADETERPTGYEPAAAAAEAAPAPPAATLLASLDAADVRSRFLDIQAGFVDEPRQAVEEAGRFVEELVQQVIGALQAQRGQLHGVLAEGSTEDLRLALRGYRQFVDRLLGLAL